MTVVWTEQQIAEMNALQDAIRAVQHPPGIREAYQNKDLGFLMNSARKMFNYSYDNRFFIMDMWDRLGFIWDVKAGNEKSIMDEDGRFSEPFKEGAQIFRRPMELFIDGKHWIKVPERINNEPELLQSYFPDQAIELKRAGKIINDEADYGWEWQALVPGLEPSPWSEGSIRPKKTTIGTYMIANESSLAFRDSVFDAEHNIIAHLPGSHFEDGSDLYASYDDKGKLHIYRKNEAESDGRRIVTYSTRIDQSEDWRDPPSVTL